MAWESAAIAAPAHTKYDFPDFAPTQRPTSSPFGTSVHRNVPESPGLVPALAAAIRPSTRYPHAC